MNDNSNIFGKRLAQARRMKGFSLEELAKAVTPSVSRQAINKYEKGLMMPDSGMLISLSGVLGMKIDYFFRPFTVEVNNVNFRKRSRMPEAVSAAIREKVREELERYLEAEQLCGCNTKFSLHSSLVGSVKEACDHAAEVREKLGLGMDGISNVIEVLEDNGIKVVEIDEDSSFDGLSGYANDTIPVIVVNRNLDAERKRFTLLHELAHLVLEFKNSMSSKEKEHICNAFASELLLPSVVLLSRLGNSRHDISLPELRDLQRQYGISIDAIMYSLKALGVISGRHYIGYLDKKKNFPDFKTMVERTVAIPETSGRFARMVYRSLADGIISVSKAAVLLNTSVDSVKNRLQLV